MASETLTLYGNPYSQPVRSVEIFLKLNNIPFEFHDIDMTKGKHKTPEYLAINRYGQIPSITHGSFALNESAAIITYTADYFHLDNQWYPTNIQERAKINAYMHWHHANTRRHAAGLVFPLVIIPKFFGGPELAADQTAVLQENFRNLLTTLDSILSTSTYIANTQLPSIADIHCYSELAELELIAYDFSPFTNVTRWQAEISSIPTVAESHVLLRELAQKLLSN